MADVGAELDLDERDVSRDGEQASDLELRVDPDFLLFGTSCNLNLSLRLSPFGRGRNSLGGSRGFSWARELIEPCIIAGSFLFRTVSTRSDGSRPIS